ncbi:adsorption protein B [Altererythrobacter atlanticus]|uniref:Bacteriophage N4 adsorption protein B n=1 Tax=Croceibacterium atlanticum TaxID=1267766 RepID=A0A0F7KTL8_9SPHN|nr:glycosyl transferase family protein [Croceibacterium atlanticum]AKH42486.1 bacteriophage N4 adsorption protein B [Croceibacterium atlanticum]MBB5731263.1 adsorption protein B [Croceibacterium atlanticum]
MTIFEILAQAEYELLLFAGTFFLLGALDEFAMDLVWIWLRLSGRARSIRINRKRARERVLSGPAAVFIPAWREEEVIELTVAHALSAWPQADLRLYVGCYRNDPGTAEAVMRAASGDSRVRLVINDRDGPTTKADCLNRLYAALEEDERRSGREFSMVVLHDAEDMVDSAALGLLDHALERAEFVQLPVLPEPQRHSRWVGSHYCEEFAESHGKELLVRCALGAGLPAAGVGCAFSRPVLATIARRMNASGPFSLDSLTEDYELGLRVKAAGGRARLLRARGEDGQLVATRAYFPSRLDQSVRQKARWVHGIALQGWDRLGWSGGAGEWWMRLRDRRGPLSAFVLLSAYGLLLLSGILFVARGFSFVPAWHADPVILALIAANFASLLWRAGMRFLFTAREYGLMEGLRAVLRLPMSNIIAIMAGRRAVFAYLGTLAGAPPRWDKTTHDAHPASAAILQTAR